MSQAFLPLEPYTVTLQCHSLKIPSSTSLFQYEMSLKPGRISNED